ncbi:hypothetical protein [Streptomyces corynorhini]|uniref:hypothetical protein n=1 Tax=Streptomyces corynorhini TaxID=2282652 RepID=UPI0011C05FC7|nr:hypothetical protein [Streptomyces corynorhini]
MPRDTRPMAVPVAPVLVSPASGAAPAPGAASDADPGANESEPSPPTAEQLSARTAERNKRSSRGGV